MKNFVKSIFAVLLFLFSQVLGSAVAFIYIIITDENVRNAFISGDKSLNLADHLTADAISFSLIVSSFLTIACLYLFKFVDKKTVFCTSNIKWKWAPVIVLGAFAGIFATNMLTELADLPDLMEAQFLEISRSGIGIFSIAVLGPLAEEFTFREAFIGNFLKDNINPWIAIFLSALCFGIAHLNPAQVPFAFIIGLVLGIVYYKTGNIVLTSIIHILNNSIAVIQMNVLGDKANDFVFKNVLGGADIPVIIILAAFCIFILYKFWHKYTPNI